MSLSYIKLKKKLIELEDFFGEDAWKNLIILTVVGLFSFASEASFIFVLQGFFKSIGLVSGKQLFLPPWYPEKTIFSLAFLLLFGLARSLSVILKSHYSTKAQFSFGYKQRKNLLTIGLKHSNLVSFKEIFSHFGETVSNGAVAIFNCSSILSVILTSLFYFFLGLRLAPYEMCIGFCLLGGFYYPIKKITSKISKISKGITLEWEQINNLLMRGLKNNLYLNIYNQVDKEIAGGLSVLKNYNTHYINYSLISSLASAIPAFLGIAIVSILSFVSIAYIHTDPMKLIAFFYIFMRLSQTASEVSGTISHLRVNLPRLRRLYELNEAVKELGRGDEGKIIFPDCDQVELRGENLAFSYKNCSRLFSNINFDVKSGEVLLIKGESGSGKSSLLSLILGLNSPTEGSVYLNNIKISEKSYDFQKILAYVGPEPFLIQGTIRENLTYGFSRDLLVSDESIWEALKIVELEQLIISLPHTLNEPIGDIPSLSTGQKQRLSLARAIIRSPKLLILDEATANLDIDTEGKIIKNLSSVFSKSVVVIVSHKNTFDGIATFTINL